MELPIGTLADQLYELAQSRGLVEAQVADLKRQEEELKDRILKIMEEQQMSSVAGTKCTISIDKVNIPGVKNWPVFLDFLRDNDLMHLMQKRISTEAYKEVVEARGEELPGVSTYVKTTFSMRKLGAKKAK
jgi:hypothetical protein